MKDVEKELKKRSEEKHSLFCEINEHAKELVVPLTRLITEEDERKRKEARRQLAAAYRKRATLAKQNPLRQIRPRPRGDHHGVPLIVRLPEYDFTWGFDGMELLSFPRLTMNGCQICLCQRHIFEQPFNDIYP